MISRGADEIKVVSSCYLNLNKQRVTFLLALYFAMSLNVQTHFKNLTVLPAFVSAHLGTLYIKLLTIDVNKTEV